MVKLYSCCAQDGDYFWLRYKNDEESIYHNLVVDGGRKSNAADFCKMLEDIYMASEKVDAIFLTHFDRDHIMGMLAGLQKAERRSCIPPIERLYLNTGEGYLRQHRSCRDASIVLPEEKVEVLLETQGYSAGDAEKLVDFLRLHGLQDCLKDYVSQSNEPIIIGDAKLYIISPNEERLLRLIQSWPGLEQTVETTTYGGIGTGWEHSLEELMEQSAPEDGSISNGASIAFLFEFEQIRIAFLGDAYPSVCMDGLSKLGYSIENPCCVDLIKLSHHGSRHNCSEKMLQILRSKHYLLSTDGRSGRLPDKLTVAKIIKAGTPATVHCNYKWWTEPVYRDFFTEEDKKNWIAAGHLKLVKLSMDGAADELKNGLELYGFGNPW